MSLRSKQAVDNQADTRKRAFTRELFEEVQTEAYFLWQKRGSRHGDEVSDWLAAEENLVSRAGGSAPPR